MGDSNMFILKNIFRSRLKTLSHLLDVAEEHSGGDIESLLEKRIADDMLPFATQIVYTCNQARNFSRWCQGLLIENLEPDLESFATAREVIAETLTEVNAVNVEDEKLEQVKRVELGNGLYMEVPGHDYVHDFLIPNLYFHMVTAYDILRMVGVPVGKRDYMTHLLPVVRHD